jgi:hypothetical protein
MLTTFVKGGAGESFSFKLYQSLKLSEIKFNATLLITHGYLVHIYGYFFMLGIFKIELTICPGWP